MAAFIRSCRRVSGLVLLAMLLALPVRAETLLRLAETATVSVHPDELAATLRTEAVGATATAAQAKVNTAMAGALARAKATAGVTAATGGYNVYRLGPIPNDTDKTERWQASQSLELHGHDGAAMLKLVGDLQTAGLAVGQLGWRLSPDAMRKARAEATRQALAGLRGRADDAAAALGLTFDSFKEIRLDSVRPAPGPRLAMAAVSMAAAAPAPPSAEAEDIPVSATAEADIRLKPR
jgi:predicted secreted protein